MIQPWKKISQELEWKKYGKRVDKVIFQMPDGREEDYYIRQDHEVVCILPITENNEVILAKQFRPGPDMVMMELPGGGMEEGEDPLSAAKRELQEETGYMGDLQLVTKCYEDAYSTIHRNVFVATNCKQVGDQDLDENEDIEVVKLSLEEFRELLRSGNMTDVEVGYLGLDHLNLL